MKPPSISNLNSNYGSYKKNNLNPSYIQSAGVPKGKNVSFGSLGSGVKDFTTGVFKFIDNSGFFVEFLIIDTISLVLPRIWIGLNRDKDKTGHFNYKAGKEEAGRESLSGPSLSLIPMGILAAFRKVKPASHMERATIEGLTSNMKKVVEAAKPSVLTNKKALNEQLADKLFDAFFGENFKEKEKIQQYKKQFKAALIKATEEKPRSVFDKIFRAPDLFGDAAKKFAQKVTELNNKGIKAPLNVGAVIVNGNEISAGHLFEDFHNYSKDILEKFVKQVDTKALTAKTSKKLVKKDVLNKVASKTAEAMNACKAKSVEFLDKLTSNRLKLKTGTAVTAFIALGSFLLYLPKIYQQSGLSPAQESAIRAGKETSGGANENT